MLLRKEQDLEKESPGFIFNNPLNNDYIDNDDSANYSDVDGNNNKKKMVWTQE